jgi:hypothetical protein
MNSSWSAPHTNLLRLPEGGSFDLLAGSPPAAGRAGVASLGVPQLVGRNTSPEHRSSEVEVWL